MTQAAGGVMVLLVNNDMLILRIALATELGAAVLLGTGMFTPIAGVILVAVTATLVFVAWPHEYPLYLLFAAVATALAGGTGVLALGLGLGAAAAFEGARPAGVLAAKKASEAGADAR